ncbi:MAG: DUF108 domain-containing protein [Candidatus Omnitrophica bacterium]|nr:DUF108 domain-containing protein [Candidatus Omnitrophota bacterium]
MKKILKIGVVGCGAIGTGVSEFIESCLEGKAVLTALADKNPDKARLLKSQLKLRAPIVDIDGIVEASDLIIEAASQAAACEVLEKAIEKGKDVVILSVGALIKNIRFIPLAEKKGVTIYVPSGAICGIDGISSLSINDQPKITITTSKPIQGLIGAEYFKRKGIDVSAIKEPTIVFKGGVNEAIENFPKNINVAATLLLATTIDFSSSDLKNKSNIEVCIKADPGLKRNVHSITVEAENARLSIVVENVPSRQNPKTSALTILSIQNLLKRMFSSLKVG